MSKVSSYFLLFFDPNNKGRNVYALSYPTDLNEIPALKEFLKKKGIKDIHKSKITFQSSETLVAAKIQIFVKTSSPFSESFRYDESNRDLFCRLFKMKEMKLNQSYGAPRKEDDRIRKKSLNPLTNLFISGADIPFLDSTGGTLLHFAAESGQDELFEVLLECGADVNRKKTDGSTALHSALSKIHQHNVSFAEKIIDIGGDVNAITADGKTPLHFAVKLSNWCIFDKHGDKAVPVVELLLESGADVNATDVKRATPLISAYRSPELMQLLISEGALIDAETSEGRTVLLEAVENGDWKAAERILELRPNTSVAGNKEAFHAALAADFHHTELIDLMFQRGFAVGTDDVNKPRVLFGAILNGLSDIVKTLLEMGVEVNQQHSDMYNSMTPLHYAVKNNNEQIVQLLMEHGADVNARCSGDYKTPLSIAVHKSNIKLVKLFFEANADDQTNPELLSYALRDANANVLEFLLESGLDPSFVNEDGSTCMAFFSEHSMKTLHLLIKFGACFRYSDYHPDNWFNQKFLGYFPINISAGDLQKLYKHGDYELDRHLVKLEMLYRCKIKVKPELASFVQKCQAEAEKLNDNIGDTPLKYRDILTSDRVIRYARNPSVVKAMEHKKVKNRFPIYSNMLTAKFQMADLRRTLTDQVVPIMGVLVSQFSPPNYIGQPALGDELMERIISYLSIRDLVVLKKFLRIKQASIMLPLNIYRRLVSGYTEKQKF